MGQDFREEPVNETKRTLEEKLEWASEGKERWQQRLTDAENKTTRASEMGGGILGFGASGNQRAAKQVRSAFGSADRAYREATEKLEYFTNKARGYSARIQERDRVQLGREQILGASWVKHKSYGWRKVVRVNAKSVSVDSGYSWVDRIEFAGITEVR